MITTVKLSVFFIPKTEAIMLTKGKAENAFYIIN